MFKKKLPFIKHWENSFIQFKTKNSQPIDISICIDRSRTNNNSYTKFLGLIVNNTHSWKPNIEHLINKLSSACYLIRSVKPYVSTNVIILIYHSLFHAVMTYGIIFWGNSSHSTQVFRMQKKAIRIITGHGNRESCRNLFKELNILPFILEYIIPLITFVSINQRGGHSESPGHKLRDVRSGKV